LQALNLMNDTIYLEASRKLAERLMRREERERLDWGMRVVLGRGARPGELTVLEGALGKFRQRYRASPEDAVKYLNQGESPRDPALDPVELAAYTGVASLLMNMDEAVTRQ
jgi:hypothetical protein